MIENMGRETRKFLSLILEKVEELHDRDWDYQYDAVCEDFEMEDIDPDDYGNNEYDYASKTKAKHACKEQLGVMINDVKEQYEEMRNERYEEIMEKCADVKSDLSDILDDFMVEIEDFLDECEDDIAMEEIRQLADSLNLNELPDRYDIEEQTAVFVSKILPEQTNAVKKMADYLEKCDFDEEDDMYAYDLENAAVEMVEDVNKAVSDAMEKLYAGLEIVYKDVRDVLGFFILKTCCDQLVQGTESSVMPELLHMDELADKLLQEHDDTPAVGKVLNRSMRGLFSVMQGTVPDDPELSLNGKDLEDMIRRVNEYGSII